VGDGVPREAPAVTASWPRPGSGLGIAEEKGVAPRDAAPSIS